MCTLKGLRCRISPTCTLSQNGYGDVVMCTLAKGLACRFAAAMRLQSHHNHINEVTVVHLAPSSGHCKAFSTTIPPLQVALSFACSVASLSHSPQFSTARLAPFTRWHPCRLLAWLGQSIHMQGRTYQALVDFHTQSP